MQYLTSGFVKGIIITRYIKEVAQKFTIGYPNIKAKKKLGVKVT
jgi:hypothetical protein